MDPPQSPAGHASISSSSDTLEELPEPDEHIESPMRKRPRLGSVASRNKPTADAPQSDDPARDSSRRPSIGATSSEHSISGVTINLRSPKQVPQPGLSQNHDPLSERNLRALEAHKSGGLAHDDDTILVTSVHRRCDSPTMSSSDSSVIEIQIQDDDDFGGSERYDSIVELVGEIPLGTQIVRSFPLVDQMGSEQALAFALRIDKEADLDFGYLQRVSEWIEDWLPHARDSPRWMIAVVENLEFFTKLATVFVRFLNRKLSFSNFSRGERLRTERLHMFLLSYQKLCCAMVTLDLRSLQRSSVDSRSPPELCCYRYLKGLDILYNISDPAPLWIMLFSKHSFASERHQQLLARSFLLDDSVGFSNLTNFTESLVKEHSWHMPTIYTPFFHSLHIASMVITHVSKSRSCIKEDLSCERLNTCAEYSASLVHTLSKELHDVIGKPTIALQTENYRSVIEEMGSLLQHAAFLSARLAEGLFEANDLGVAGIEPKLFPRLLRAVLCGRLWWRMAMKGRMELRVYGVASMSKDVADIWTAESLAGREPSRTASINYMASFMVKEGFMDYITSVESHPQLLSRSGNIWHLLAATLRWTPEMTENTWNLIATSPDPRVTSQILVHLKRVTDFANADNLLQHLKRLSSLSIEAYTIDLLHLTWTMCIRLGNGVSYPNEARTVAYNLAIRLQSESYLLDEDRGNALRNAIHGCVKHLATTNSGLEERLEVYQTCMSEIQSRSETVVGSLDTILSLASNNVREDLQVLFEQHDVMKTIVSELCAFVRRKCDMPDDRPTAHELNVRLRLLSFLLQHGPESSLPQELETDLWECLVGSSAVNAASREQGWRMLVQIVDERQQTSVFIDRFICSGLPTLLPECLTNGALTFVGTAQKYLQRVDPRPVPTDGHVIDIPMANITWKIVLNASEADVTARAVAFLSKQHLDSTFISEATSSSVAATHTAFVKKCVDFLEAAATSVMSNSQDMLLSSAEYCTTETDTIGDARTQFKRTLQVLTQFLHDVKCRPRFHHSPKASNPPSPTGSIRGEPVTVRYQAFGDGMEPKIRNLRIGSLDTQSELLNRLHAVTGFKTMMVIHGGRKIDLSADPTRSLGDVLNKGHLLIRNTGEQIERRRGSQPDLGNSSAEIAILEHFDDLYRFLDSEGATAQAVYEFLIQFPPHAQIHELCLSGSLALHQLFPTHKPQKTLYSLWSMQRHLALQLSAGRLEEDYLLNCVKLLAAAITSLDLLTQSLGSAEDGQIASQLTICFLTFLTERPPPSVSAQYFDEATATDIVGKLCDTLNSLIQPFSPINSELVVNIYAALIEVASHSDHAFEAFRVRHDIKDIHRCLLLEIPDDFVRERVGTCATLACKGNPPDAATWLDSLSSFYWSLIFELVTEASSLPHQAKQLLSTANVVFPAASRVSLNEAKIRSYLNLWTEMLSSYTHTEVFGREEADHFLLGLVRLLSTSVFVLKGYKQPIGSGRLPDVLYDRFLFPPIDEERELHTEVLTPVLDFDTRKAIHQLILILVENEVNFERLIGKMEAMVTSPRVLDIAWNSDRTKWLRSPAGNLGLRNLTNTCYMNSLLTQLYMNTTFCSLILRSNVVDPGGSQKLLSEMQDLFACLQTSKSRSANTSNFASAVKPYDAPNIDVTIQMDVDEFFNLLFDRLEGQMLTSEAKQEFRSVFGGQLVTQIKSKDCPHVSERFEPFLAVQCDVQGKANLAESLKSYVEGDVMEGDNKYKCESCGGRFVAAVKRSCFKDMPDNLIFHLKRFDFDLQTLQRNKINDYFEFPDRIDMSQFSLDHLTDPDTPVKQDVFELVGVLVHTGTAETGHYYSYIRGHSLNVNGSGLPWLEFNDTEVTDFDPGKIPDACFGGEVRNGEYNWSKPYSAYMLFFRRMSTTSVVVAHTPETTANTMLHDVEPTSTALQEILKDNELLIRRYCLLSPSHAGFVRGLLATMISNKDAICSGDHILEKRVITMAIDHVEQVFSRAKDVPELESTLLAIKKTVIGCSKCCGLVVDWIITRRHEMLNLLLANPNEKTRTLFGDFVSVVLAKIKERDSDHWAVDIMDENTGGPKWDPGQGVLSMIVTLLKELMPSLTKYLRNWDQYFILWSRIAAMGVSEIAVMLHEDIFLHCLEITMAGGRIAVHKSHYIEEVLEKIINLKRLPNCTEVVKCLSIFFKHLDMFASTTDDSEERLWAWNAQTLRFTLTGSEQRLIFAWDDRQTRLTFLSRLLDIAPEIVDDWIPGIVLKALMTSDTAPNQDDLAKIATTIMQDFTEYVAEYTEPGLYAATIFCLDCSNVEIVNEVIKAAVTSCQGLGTVFRPSRKQSGPQVDGETTSGKGHLAFLRTLATAYHPRLAQSPEQMFFLPQIVGWSCRWGSVLLVHEDASVREEALELLKLIIFDQFPQGRGALDDKNSHDLAVKRSNAVRLLFSAGRLHMDDAWTHQFPRWMIEQLRLALEMCAQWVDQLHARGDNQQARERFVRQTEDGHILDQWAMISSKLDHWPEGELEDARSDTEYLSNAEDESDEELPDLGEEFFRR